MGMMRELVRFYGKDTALTEDEMKLASAAKGLSEEREAMDAMAKAEDRVDIQEHIRRFHGGKLEPGESCPFLEKLKKAEEDFGTLDPKDADGDGEADFAEEEEKEEAEAEVSEDSADAIKAYFEAVAKDEFKEIDHPRESKGGKGGGQFAKKPETLEKEDSRDSLSPDESKNILLIGHQGDTDAHMNDLLGDSEVVPVHHTVSDVGLKDYISEARRTGKPLVAQSIAEWSKTCQDILADELKKGGFRCIAWSGVCPCDGHPPGRRCRCTQSQIARWRDRLSSLDSVFKVIETEKPSEEQ